MTLVNNELENLILTICPHEEANKKDKTRRALIEAWAQSLGICGIEHKEIKNKAGEIQGDYSLVGEFRDHDINLNVEYKSYTNLISGNIEDIEDKLVRTFEDFTDVAFFVDGYGSYTFSPNVDNYHCLMDYPKGMADDFKRNGINPPTMTLAGMEGLFDTLSANGVHCRQLRSEAQFPYSLYNLLVYLTNPHNLKVRETSYEQALINHYMTIPQVGYVRAKKLINNYPAPQWLNSASEGSLIQVLGNTTGIVVYQFLNNHSLETEEWRNGFHRDGTPKEPANREPVKSMVVLESVQNPIEAHLCTTCTKKPKTCNTSADNKLDNGINVMLCMGYVNKYPIKSMSEQDTKHQAFKRQKAGFKPAPPSYPEGKSIFKPPPPPPSNNTSGSLPDVQFIKVENKVSQSQGDGQQAKAEKTAPLTASQSQDLSIQPVDQRMTPNMPEMEGGSTNSPPSAPSYKNVDGYLIHHCYVPLTMDQIMSRLYPQFSKDYLFNAVCRMTNDGALRRFSDKGTMKWTVAVKADKELDVGV